MTLVIQLKTSYLEPLQTHKDSCSSPGTPEQGVHL